MQGFTSRLWYRRKHGTICLTFWSKKDSENAEIFRKIEPYLTFLNIHHLEEQGADIHDMHLGDHYTLGKTCSHRRSIWASSSKTGFKRI